MPSTPDPFDCLGLPPVFDLDARRVESAYLSRALLAHPDAAPADPSPPAPGGDIASLNVSRQTLLSHERRANALLARLAGPSSDQLKDLPPGFLAEILETREAIDDVIATGDPGERARWSLWAGEQREDYRRRVGAMFAALASPPNPRALAAIRVELNAWRYIERLIEQLGSQPPAVGA